MQGPKVVCGDGVVGLGELCDDGNDVDHDGCTQTCAPTEVLSVEAGYYSTCALLSGGAVRCWGGGVLAQLGYPGNDQQIGDDEHPSSLGPVQLGGPVIEIAVGANHACALLEGGSVRCFGYANYGQPGQANKLEIGDDEQPAAVAPVKLGAAATHLSAFQGHTCVTLAGGLVRCWGHNNLAQLGLGHLLTIGDTEFPDSQPAIKLGGVAVAVATATAHSCALLDSKQIRCWGTNSNGQIGLGYNTIVGDNDHPADFPPVVFTAVEKVTAGGGHTCVLRTGGAVHCFGSNWSGELGYGHTKHIGDSESPDAGPVALGGPAIDVDAGRDHTCAVLVGGDVRCWGVGEKGRLGLANALKIGDDELPTAVPPIKLGGKALRVSAGHVHTCVLLEGGRVRCWGTAFNGQLGYANKNDIGDDEHPEAAGDVKLF